jgi:uncharacterized membrane protein YeiH
MRKTFLIFDTVGIGLFTILGIEKSLEMNLSPLIAVMMGVVSAVFGGVLRDVLSNQVPMIFRKEIYAFACLFGGALYLMLDYFKVEEITSLSISIVVVITVRLLSIKKQWSIPFRPLGGKN